MTIAYTYGIVDFLHFGHMRVMRKAKEASDKLIFGLIEDPAIMQFHGNTISTYEERLSVLSGVSYIDEIRTQKSFDPLKNLKQIHGDYPEAKIILYVGTDRTFVPVENYLKSIGGEIRTTDYYEKLSPLNILAALQKKVDRKEKRYSNLVSTKANTLLALKERLKKARIEDIQVVTVAEFNTASDGVFRRIAEFYNGDKIVVRSSSSAEDCYETSNAGHFDSVLNVQSDSRDEVLSAIKQVIDSYGVETENIDDEQVLIQRQTMNVICSGVIFTRDVRSNRPYYLINYDDSGSTDSVTSGMAGKSVWILRRTAKNNPPKEWRALLEAVQELESILKKMVLDIEFALTSDGRVVIFQVRPLAANYKYNVTQNDEAFYTNIEEAKAEYGKHVHYATGMPMLLSDMAFWNPSEIIGVNPRYLDYSLYREIITKRAWIEGLLPLGYTDVPGELMYKVGNKPYISVDYSFQALTPNAISEDVKQKLYREYREKLLSKPHLHDKIEFEIVHSAYDYATEKRLEALKAKGFSDAEVSEISKALYALTDETIRGYQETLTGDVSDIRQLEEMREGVQQRRGGGVRAKKLIEQIILLLEAIERYGTPQFSRQARCAFVSRQICKTMVEEGFVTAEQMDAFMNTIHSVSSEFEQDFYKYSHGQMSKEAFDKVYGHLRANTYDIRTPRYADITFQIADGGAEKNARTVTENAEATVAVAKALEALHFGAPIDEQLAFILTSIEQREYVKFIFTRSLSLAIEMLRELGEQMGLSADDMSYLTVNEVKAAKCYEEEEVKDFFATVIAQRKLQWEKKSQLMLPEMIAKVADLEKIEQRQAKPNFITVSHVQADVVVLKDGTDADITGKIVALEKADPGYDWIFAKGIAGLVTKYGGPASHMAIRCAEFGLPSAIGCGAQTFSYVCASERIEIDCNNKKINRIY